jgi:hypothetical protein
MQHQPFLSSASVPIPSLKCGQLQQMHRNMGRWKFQGQTNKQASEQANKHTHTFRGVDW